MLSGAILIDKPGSMTSFKVVSELRKILHTKKVGHAGTLDPMATGLLPVLVNKATKIQELLQNGNKEYIAEFKLGITTDTQDITGKIIKEFENVNVSEEQILSSLKKFTGEIVQTPPMYSAISKSGVRLYKLARKGIEIEREKRKINIYSLKLLDFSKKENLVRVLVNCSKGTYIRTLCADIGNYLGCGATLTSLRRTKTCNFSIEKSVKIEELENLKLAEISEKVLIPIDRILENYEFTVLNEENTKNFLNGRKFNINLDIKGHILRVYSENKIFLGLGKYNFENKELATYKLLLG